MQIIEYKCDVCGWEFRKMNIGSADDQTPVCPACGSQETHEKVSAENESDDSSAKSCSHGVFT